MKTVMLYLETPTSYTYIFLLTVIASGAATVACIIGMRSRGKGVLYFLYSILILFFLSVTVFIVVILQNLFALVTLIPAIIILTYAVIYSKMKDKDDRRSGTNK